MQQREVWLPVDPHSAIRPLIHDRNGYTEIDGSSSNPITLAEQGNYQAIAALPTDPDALLKLITAERKSDKGNQSPQVVSEMVFHAIESILAESIVPPKVAAGLYRAAAKLPGMTVVPDVTDAAGRHGVGVAVVSDGVVYTGSIRDTMIFDKKTFSYLGSTSVIAKTGPSGTAGTFIGMTAVLSRSIVDQRPTVTLTTK
ncbi:CU044_5270 family protein [Fodinicola feengrottensis]|nr:CU044_5270 family protein [Fodinicola feengrottensis]